MAIETNVKEATQSKKFGEGGNGVARMRTWKRYACARVCVRKHTKNNNKHATKTKPYMPMDKIACSGRSHSHAYNARTYTHTHIQKESERARETSRTIENDWWTEIRILECWCAILFVSIFVVVAHSLSSYKMAIILRITKRKSEQNQGQIILAVFHLFHVAYLFI